MLTRRSNLDEQIRRKGVSDVDEKDHLREGVASTSRGDIDKERECSRQAGESSTKRSVPDEQEVRMDIITIFCCATREAESQVSSALDEKKARPHKKTWFDKNKNLVDRNSDAFDKSQAVKNSQAVKESRVVEKGHVVKNGQFQSESDVDKKQAESRR
jgi:hypothetical protein